MPRMRLDAPVIGPDGETTTIAELAEQAKVEFRETIMNGRGGYVTRYFADFTGTQTGFEIGRTAYLSRSGKMPFSKGPERRAGG